MQDKQENPLCIISQTHIYHKWI